MSLNDMVTLFKKQIPSSFSTLPTELQRANIYTLILLSLAEDLAPSDGITDLDTQLKTGDITSAAALPNNKILQGRIIAKQDGMIAGLPIAQAVFKLVDMTIQFTPRVTDGESVQKHQVLAEVSGPGPSMLTAERTALNFLGRLCGIATLTNQFVAAVSGTNTRILDTRKTAPGSRSLDKYAVRKGGGINHRMGLYDMVLIKDNHIEGAGSIQAAVERVRDMFGNKYPIEVEIKDLQELQIALALNVDRIMLDNMDLETMREAVMINAGKIPLEASGNVSLETVRDIALTGLDYISSGALTHSAPSFDVSMRLS